ncbi:hypothetical protein ACYFX5_10730 [Bremerella sp. T1]|uniref:hypothetical protein n=1 Tax=Bremerella sp. TYQ1 TaxID=3119568 RepID=UPI001CCB0EC8|nr:hypothetical protein [Bremerella volcania]UBM38724.1 hypothetical protein LA756_12680 [Bremerella volcania]
MFRKTTLAACVMFAAPALLSAQEQPAVKWVDATYNENRPMTRMAAPGDLKEPGAIELSSANGTANPSQDIQRTSAVTPINNQSQSVLRTYVGQPIESESRTVVQSQSSVVVESPPQETIVQYSNEPRTIVYDNPQPMPQQEVRRVEYPGYQTQTSYYVEPTNPNPWHTINNGVQRVQYTAPATYSTPMTTTGNPVVVNRPVTTIAYNNPPVVQTPVVTGTVPVPNATVYPVDRTSFRPVLPIIPMNNNSYVGRGLLGQPKVYTEGQPIRNSLRYILP